MSAPTFDELHTPHPYSEWHKDFGYVLWWLMPIYGAPYSGSPNCDDWPWDSEDEPDLWWTPLPDCNLIQERWEAEVVPVVYNRRKAE